MKKNKAFTLAEILITLSVIGVIAAIILTTVINNKNKQEYFSKLQKTYSTLSQATNMIISKEGSPFGDGGWALSLNEILEQYKTYLSNIKVCDVGHDCFSKEFKLLGLNRNDADWSSFGTRKGFIMADGTQVLIWSSNGLIRMIVDINGEKGPNKYGLDGFWFYVGKNGLYPRGCEENNSCIDSDKVESWMENNGKGCACRALREGAINYY